MRRSSEGKLSESRLHEIRDEAALKARTQGGKSENGDLDSQTQPRASADAGYYGIPLLKTPAWTWEIPTYFFVGGAAGAAAVLACVGRLRGADRDLVHDARWLAAIGGAISPGLLVSDLGMPSRFLNMLRVFKVQSPMSVGSWTLVAFSSTAAAAVLLAELEKRRRGPRIPILADAMEIGSAISGLVLATYTGILVGATAIPVWNENVGLLPIHFAASGLSAAVSMLELRGHTNHSMNRIGIGAAALETAVGASLEFGRKRATEPLHTGPTGWTMRVAGLLSGPLPLALRLIAGTKKNGQYQKLRKTAALSTVIGSLLTRWAWVMAGRVSAKDPKVPLQLPGPPRTDMQQLPADK